MRSQAVTFLWDWTQDLISLRFKCATLLFCAVSVRRFICGAQSVRDVKQFLSWGCFTKFWHFSPFSFVLKFYQIFMKRPQTVHFAVLTKLQFNQITVRLILIESEQRARETLYGTRRERERFRRIRPLNRITISEHCPPLSAIFFLSLIMNWKAGQTQKV